jgi:hypothetical protein
MTSQKLAIRSRKLFFSVGIILILAAGALATGIGIVFQGFETGISTWTYAGNNADITQEPSGYMDGSGEYANGIASATGSYHARIVPDPSEGLCLDDGGAGAPPNNDCYGPYTTWNSFYVLDGVTTQGSNIVTSATANFNPTEVGFNLQAYGDDFGDSIFPVGTTITSVINSTTVTVSTNAVESYPYAGSLYPGASVNYYPVFTLGYITQLDIYLDTNWAANNNDYRFDWDSGIGDQSGSEFLSDYVFNVGTELAGDNTPGFWVSTSPNAFRNSTYPENPCPAPSNDGLGNYCRAPVKITTSGWYTFRHIFRIDPNTQNLSVEFQVIPEPTAPYSSQGNASPVVDTTIYGWQGNAQAPAGGIQAAYGYFPNIEIQDLAVDNSLLKDFDTLALAPTTPSNLAAGTTQTFTVSASLFGTADPLTPGLTPANFSFTNGNTGLVSVVPSGTQPGNGTLSYVATGTNVGPVSLTANLDVFTSNTVAGFDVTQGSQSITVATPAPPTAYKGFKFTVGASASSGLPITFASNGPCTNVGATYTMNGDKGTCFETMTQPGNNNYTAATQVIETTTGTAPVTPLVSFTGMPASGATYGNTYTVTASSTNDFSVPTIAITPATVNCAVSNQTPSSGPNGTTTVTATVTMTGGEGYCEVKAAWAANYIYSAASVTTKTAAAKFAPMASFTGAPANADNGSTFIVTASNQTSGDPSVPKITAGGSCTVGAPTNTGPGSYQATVTMSRATGACNTKAEWAATTDYLAASGTQTTAAQP